MGISQFTDLISLSTIEISDAILKEESELFKLRLKKATRQDVKSHKIKETKRRLAQLKTLLSSRPNNPN